MKTFAWTFLVVTGVSSASSLAARKDDFHARVLQAGSTECVPTGGDAGDGDCGADDSGCCDLLVVCGGDGTCSLPPAGCTSDASCADGEVCAAGVSCEPEDDTAFEAFGDITSPLLGVMTTGSKEIFLVGERDDTGEPVRITEMVMFDEDIDDTIHTVFDVSGVPTIAYFDERNEVVSMVYDDDGNFVSATVEVDDTGDQRRLMLSKTVEYSHLQHARRHLRGLFSQATCDTLCSNLSLLLDGLSWFTCGAATGQCGVALAATPVLAAAVCAVIAGLCLAALAIGRDAIVDYCEDVCVCPTPAPTTPAPNTPAPTPSPLTPNPASSPSPATPAPAPICPPGTDVCEDPHMKGLRGQRIDWSGVDGGWYCLVKDEDISLQINTRLTAPLAAEFPNRQLMTALSVVYGGHSVVIEVKDPYTTTTGGCPGGISPCLADGGVRIIVDGQETGALLAPTRDKLVADGMAMSAFNMPVECQSFGGDKIWASLHKQALQSSRTLRSESFEDWLLEFTNQAAPAWCTMYVAEQGLANVQSDHAVFRISTPMVTVRLDVGVNHQDGGEVDWDGRALPDMFFWQMDVGFQGLSVEHESLSGLLGETARPVLDDAGLKVMKGPGAMRGTVEDYRVSGALGQDFPLLHQ